MPIRENRNAAAQRLLVCERELDAARAALEARPNAANQERHRKACEALGEAKLEARNSGVINDPLVRMCDVERILGLPAERCAELVRDGRLAVELVRGRKRFRLSHVRRLAFALAKASGPNGA